MKKFITVIIIIVLSAFFFSDFLHAYYPKGKHKWKYIVIHHSATKIGNTKRFDLYHKKVRGMKNGVAYHFVICNGTSGSKNGEIEITTRWEKQIAGGHCRLSNNNEYGIGICLVGDFQKTPPTEKQFWSLVWLVRKLMREYNIPLKNVRGHKNMKGEKTKCPGRYFPWTRLKKEIPKKR